MQEKLFCISLQRVGTSSVNKFLYDQKILTAGWHISRRNFWTELWLKGDYESIFESTDFLSHQAFEDDPWWCGDFYKVLFNRFINSRFILFYRNPDKWFDSMKRHSEGKNMSNTYLHSRLYRRESDFENIPIDLKERSQYSNIIDLLLEINETHREHYINIFKIRHKEVLDFFRKFGNDRLFVVNLEDPEKWVKLGSYLGIKVPQDYECHAHKEGGLKLISSSDYFENLRKQQGGSVELDKFEELFDC